MKRAAVLAIVFLCLAGCSSRLVTNTSRSAIEQMLLTGAVDKALAKFSLAEVEGAKVFLDCSNLAAVDAPYIKTAARARFCELGATLVDEVGEADLIAEVACGALGTEFKTAMVGLPPLPVPNSPIPLPEASLYSWQCVLGQSADELAGAFDQRPDGDLTIGTGRCTFAPPPVGLLLRRLHLGFRPQRLLPVSQWVTDSDTILGT